jgi:hypothetical protein
MLWLLLRDHGVLGRTGLFAETVGSVQFLNHLFREVELLLKQLRRSLGGNLVLLLLALLLLLLLHHFLLLQVDLLLLLL